jgi:hypothetical protein
LEIGAFHQHVLQHTTWPSFLHQQYVRKLLRARCLSILGKPLALAHVVLEEIYISGFLKSYNEPQGNAARRRYAMSTRGSPTRSKAPPTKRMPSLNSARSAEPAVNEIVPHSRLQTPKTKTQPTNGDAVFDTKAFLARAGLGKNILSLKKNETAFAQGDASEAIFLRAER